MIAILPLQPLVHLDGRQSSRRMEEGMQVSENQLEGSSPSCCQPAHLVQDPVAQQNICYTRTIEVTCYQKIHLIIVSCSYLVDCVDYVIDTFFLLRTSRFNVNGPNTDFL